MADFAQIPFAPSQESASDQLSGASPAAINVVADANGTLYRRPGLVDAGYDLVSESGEPISGLHVTEGGVLYAAVNYGSSTSQANAPGYMSVYLMQERGDEFFASLAFADSVTGRPIFAETEALLLVANGRGIRKIPLAQGIDGGFLANAPQASHVIGNASRVLANDVRDRAKVFYSAPNLGTQTIAGHEYWDAATSALGNGGFFTAESRPDPVVALHENTNEVWVFGSSSFQCYAPDATLDYATISTRDFGCSAPWSIVKDDQNFSWIDHKRRIVSSDGRMVTVLSEPIHSQLEALSGVATAYGMRIHHRFMDCLVWVFPDDGTAFCFNKNGGWTQWRGYSRGNWASIPWTAAVSVPGSNVQLVGTATGRIRKVSLTASDDADSNPINAYVTTGFLGHSTDLRKRCNAVTLTLRRGTATNSNDHVLLDWRDGEGAWSSPIRVDLGPSGTRENVVSLRGLGVYRRRQWRISFHGSGDFALAGAQEEYDVLRN